MYNCSKRKIRDLLTADFAWLCAAAPDFDFGILVTTPFMCTVVLKFSIKFFWRKKNQMLRSKNLIYTAAVTMPSDILFSVIYWFWLEECFYFMIWFCSFLFSDVALKKTENITRFWDNIPLLLPPLKTHHCIRLTFFKLDFANIVPKISFAP